jgi:hypothetical protein
LGEVGRERGEREVVVGVEEHRAGENERLTTKHTKDTKVGIGFWAHGTHGIHGKEGSGEKAVRAGAARRVGSQTPPTRGQGRGCGCVGGRR